MLQGTDFDDLLTHVPLDSEPKAELTARMSEPSRRYHGIGHLEVLWRRHRAHADEAGLADPMVTMLIACAIAYHDSVYDGHRADNEDLSAMLWMKASETSELTTPDREWVAATIRATENHLAYDPGLYAELPQHERARLWLLDLDLTPLAELPDEFDLNSRNLRDEVPDFTEAKWMTGAHMFLKHIAGAPRIYRSPVLAAHYEERARSNIARELARPVPAV
jgi:predicted metal-dependent HD superfamily phosphohydrolase